jgi:hypothetical protein
MDTINFGKVILHTNNVTHESVHTLLKEKTKQEQQEIMYKICVIFFVNRISEIYFDHLGLSRNLEKYYKSFSMNYAVKVLLEADYPFTSFINDLTPETKDSLFNFTFQEYVAIDLLESQSIRGMRSKIRTFISGTEIDNIQYVFPEIFPIIKSTLQQRIKVQKQLTQSQIKGITRLFDGLSGEIVSFMMKRRSKKKSKKSK